MRRLTFLAVLSALIASCAAPAPELPTVEPATITATLPPSPTATVIPSPTATSTLTPTPVPCDPAVGYCLLPGDFPFRRPLPPAAEWTIDPSYRFGDSQSRTRQPHHGVEFPNPTGTPVLAAADGTVFYAGNDDETFFSSWIEFYGNLVIIEHAHSLYTLYAHLSKFEVETGEVVRAGQEIGEVGATGAAIGSHLHFEVRAGGTDYTNSRNPILFLEPVTGEHDPAGVLAGRVVDGQGTPLVLTVNVQYYPDDSGAAYTWRVNTYEFREKKPVGSYYGENFALGDLPPGRYRITLITAGMYFERWVEVQAGRITMVAFVVK
jgi:hypothetical protein